MKLQINYLNDQNGKLQAVQLPIAEWEKLQEKVLFYEQKLNLRQDLSEAFRDLEKMQQGTKPKQELSDFLNEL